ncbi:GILT-like protein 2 isoform X2 [Ischnura elegans]|uniref:GILT-like protein 2 isoform X2 n=1 Tax=Ischnura elegans TaxID=197161 RepID=UPI001ED88968|nr:GILT-like protein 2 isoform X2 [Ischnura elegans]
MRDLFKPLKQTELFTHQPLLIPATPQPRRTSKLPRAKETSGVAMIGKSAAALMAFMFSVLVCQSASHPMPRYPPVDKLEIAIYYETFCPDSKRFLTEQLPKVLEMAMHEPYITFKFVPFGLATSQTNSDGDVNFSCQHGLKECVANTLHSIALNIISDPLRQAQFLSCVMKDDDPTALIEECGALVGLRVDDVNHYYKTKAAENLQLLAEAETNKIQNPLSFVPTIVYNGVFNQNLLNQTLDDFNLTICSLVLGICAI